MRSSNVDDVFGWMVVVWNRAPAPLRVALCVASPPPCGDARYDAALAAISEYHLTNTVSPLPEWVCEPGRSLVQPWVVRLAAEVGKHVHAACRSGYLGPRLAGT
jgi:hypothetical protein